ncbi:hypothetical protein [Agrococcus versicolor]
MTEQQIDTDEQAQTIEAVERTLVCDVCDEELEWVDGYALAHRGGEVGYFHTLVAVTPEDSSTP